MEKQNYQLYKHNNTLKFVAYSYKYLDTDLQLNYEYLGEYTKDECKKIVSTLTLEYINKNHLYDSINMLKKSMYFGENVEYNFNKIKCGFIVGKTCNLNFMDKKDNGDGGITITNY